MKTFLDLLATNLSVHVDLLVESADPCLVTICVNDQQLRSNDLQFAFKIAVLTPIDIRVHHTGAYVKSLKFDGWECRPQYGQETPGLWKFNTNGLPFYQWQHHATGQGWLLNPQ